MPQSFVRPCNDFSAVRPLHHYACCFLLDRSQVKDTKHLDAQKQTLSGALKRSRRGILGPAVIKHDLPPSQREENFQHFFGLPEIAEEKPPKAVFCVLRRLKPDSHIELLLSLQNLVSLVVHRL